GCGVSPCKTGTGFLTYRLAAGTESADAIDVTLAVGDAAAQTTRVARKTRAASGSIEVDFHAYPKAQPLTVTLTARLGDDILATATQATTAGARCTTLSFDLAAVSGGDVDMSDATDLVDDG